MQTQDMLSSWQAKSSGIKDLEMLTELMSEHDDITVAQFCKKVRVALENDAASNQKKTSKKSSELDVGVIEEYKNKFLNGGLDREQLMELLNSMKSDKRLKKNEAVELNSKITGLQKSFKSKAQALKAIEEWVHRKFDTERRLERTSDVF